MYRNALLATWGRKNGDQNNCSDWPPVCTYEGMDDLLQERYRYMADENEALLSPVAWVWRYIRENYPEINLYTSDNSHPSMAGSYAAAATFYTLMFENNPEEISFNSNLSAEVADKIRSAVKTIVYDDLANWNVGKYDPQADFTYSETQNPLEFQFDNQSEFATEFHWDFGDGTTSTEENPVHTYVESGNYTVKLSVSNCGKESLMEMGLNADLGLNEPNQTKEIRMYPNPVKDYLNIQNLGKTDKIRIYDVSGKLISEVKETSPIDFTKFPSGSYILQVLDVKNKLRKSIRFVKN